MSTVQIAKGGEHQINACELGILREAVNVRGVPVNCAYAGGSEQSSRACQLCILREACYCQGVLVNSETGSEHLTECMSGVHIAQGCE